MIAIGGYFGLETQHKAHFHKEAVRLNSARNCLEYVLRCRQYKKLFIPYYTCKVILEPLIKLGIPYEFYHINELLEPTRLPDIKKDEGFLYTNYFGLKQNCVKTLANHYGNQLIVDNAQAFFAEPLQNIDTFYSPRKFFGVADGAYLYTDMTLDNNLEQAVSCYKMSHLLKRIDLGAEAGYTDFQTNDDSLSNLDIMKMSKLTETILQGIDYELSKQIRRDNYVFLNDNLGSENLIHLSLDEESVPLVYPFLTDDISLKQKLIDNKIFVATYWPNVLEWCKENDWESKLTRQTCLPIDQRYGQDEMTFIIKTITA